MFSSISFEAGADVRDVRTYDVAGDANLMRSIESAVARHHGWREVESSEIRDRLRPGWRHPFLAPEQR